MDSLSNTPVTADTLIAKAHAMAPALQTREDAAEAARRIPDESIADMRAAGLFRAFQPARYGGYELDLDLLLTMGTELARGCGSSAWVGNLAMVHQWMIAGFSEHAQDDIWGDTPTGNPDAIALGTYAAAAEAMPVEGGFRISGKWPFASGCDHGDWALLGARFPANADGRKPVPGLVLVPRGDYEIIDDWHAVGLAASGSKTIACNDLFVPGHRHVLFPDLASGRGPGRAVNTGAIFGVPLLAVLPVTIAAPALGILAAAIVDFTERTRVRETRGAVAGGGHSMAGFANVQSKLAEAAVALDAATLLLQRDISETLAIAKSCGIFSVDHRIRNRLSHGYAVKLAVDAINGLYGVGGGAELYRTGRLQRAWRDINAIAHHIGLNWDAISTMAGQHRLGLEPQGQY
jgi:alkylation response protein AidB-like acyl-CoA dehydrogenase